jgi:ribonuclease-3
MELLVLALSHRSWCAEHGDRPSNERLEFLGDAVLSLVVAEWLYREHGELAEGAMAQVRAAVVNTAVLAEAAAELGIDKAVLLGRGEELSGGREKASILADAFEAVLGAVYLEGGLEAARGMVERALVGRMAEAAAGPGLDDPKTRLQEQAVRDRGVLPRYVVSGSGPDHDRRFVARVYLGSHCLGKGRGRSKKDAEQAAAKAALLALSADSGFPPDANQPDTEPARRRANQRGSCMGGSEA